MPQKDIDCLILFNKMTKDIIISRDVIFLEDQNTDQTKIEKPPNFNHFLIDLDPVEISENIQKSRQFRGRRAS